MKDSYAYMNQRRDDKSIPLCYMTMCGRLHYAPEKITLESELLENCGQLYQLSLGTPVAAEINNITYPGFLDSRHHPTAQKWEWTIVGLDIWGTELEGLSVRVPIYVKIERDDGKIFDFENPGTLNAGDYNIGRHFYRYSDMNISQAVSMHMDGILKPIDEEDRFVLKLYTDDLIRDAGVINRDTLQLVRDSCNNVKRYFCRWTPEKYLDDVNHWIEAELKSALGMGTRIYRGFESRLLEPPMLSYPQPAETPPVMDAADETEPKGIRYYG